MCVLNSRLQFLNLIITCPILAGSLLIKSEVKARGTLILATFGDNIACLVTSLCRLGV